MALFPPGDNNPIDVVPIKSPLDGTEIVQLDSGALRLYTTPNGIGDYVNGTSGVNFVASNGQAYLSSLKIAVSSVYDGIFRYRPVSDIDSYFMCSAMSLAPSVFNKTEALNALALIIDKVMVAPRANLGAYTATTKVVFPSGKIFLCNIGGTTAASAPSDAGVTVAHTFLGDGSVTWEYTGFQVPAAWVTAGWFIINIYTNLLDIRAPDSNDAYAATIMSAVNRIGADATWLNTASSHPGYTRLQALEACRQACIDTQLSGIAGGARLTSTFIGSVKFDGSSYNIRFLADNCEVWKGLTDLSALYTIVGNASAAASTALVAADVKTGILSLWNSTYNRFNTYFGETDTGTLYGESAFVTNLRFHLWPLGLGVLSSLTEVSTYGDAVYSYTMAACPTVYWAFLDAFPMTEWYYWAYRLIGIDQAGTVLKSRVTNRVTANVTIVDCALKILLSS